MAKKFTIKEMEELVRNPDSLDNFPKRFKRVKKEIEKIQTSIDDLLAEELKKQNQ